MEATNADNLSRRSISSEGNPVPSAALYVMDLNLRNVRCINWTIALVLQIISTVWTTDGTRAVGSKRRIRAPEEIFGVHITKRPSIAGSNATV